MNTKMLAIDHILAGASVRSKIEDRKSKMDHSGLADVHKTIDNSFIKNSNSYTDIKSLKDFRTELCKKIPTQISRQVRDKTKDISNPAINRRSAETDGEAEYPSVPDAVKTHLSTQVTMEETRGTGDEKEVVHRPSSIVLRCSHAGTLTWDSPSETIQADKPIKTALAQGSLNSHATPSFGVAAEIRWRDSRAKGSKTLNQPGSANNRSI